MPDAVLFDCDGTLVDSETLSAEVFCELLGGLGHAAEPAEILLAFRGRQLAKCLADLESRFGALPSDFGDLFRARTAEVYRARLCEMAGAAELLRAMSHPVCVASNAPRAKIELCLEAAGLARFFHGRIFSAYEVGAWKPDPGLFLHAAEAMGAAPARCLVVEDSEPGVAAALAAGMRVVALLHEEAPGWVPAGVPTIRALPELRALL
ncbi:HAD family hydrolase [Falsiroseomonas oryziterrae]|uniref:HAD family hydrolase n=1 Tax=Falsiroseomonas oryziterrae TaxID=2911368 RepID=UPI001F013F16|nr:HAD-IA family hydrolase [Roseomonas sp. NPKOSM-4]